MHCECHENSCSIMWLANPQLWHVDEANCKMGQVKGDQQWWRGLGGLQQLHCTVFPGYMSIAMPYDVYQQWPSALLFVSVFHRVIAVPTLSHCASFSTLWTGSLAKQLKRLPREQQTWVWFPPFLWEFFQVQSYQWLKNRHSSGYPARRLAL